MTDLLLDWAPRVYRFALRLTRDVHLAEDLTQETLLRAWKRQDQLRELRAGRVWLFRITANLWRDHVRRGRSAADRPGRIDAELAAPTSLPEHALAQREELQKALAALDALPARQREVLYLHACEEMALPEIAEALTISTAAAKASLSLARKKLRQLFPDITSERHQEIAGNE